MLVMDGTFTISSLPQILNSLSEPLQLCHFIVIVKVLAMVRLRFWLYQFVEGRCDYW
jgi:hypothetical protein